MTAVGSGVTNFSAGDWVVPMVRRPCNGPCKPCADGRTDLCATGDYVERGIVRMHGYFTDFAVDEPRYLLRVPDNLLDCAILIEPLSVVEKAVETAIGAHNGYYGSDPPRALILGAGTIGILSAFALEARGFEAAIRSLEDRGHPRARLLESAGIRYFSDSECWPADIVIEAAGSVEALAAGALSLARNGILVTLGAPNAEVAFPFRDLIIKSQMLIGSVNATAASFDAAIRDLARFDRRTLQNMIHRVRFDDYGRTLTGPLSAHAKIVHMLG